MTIAQPSDSCSRRKFVQSVSAGLLSTVVLGSFPDAGLLEESLEGLRLVPESEPGYFSIRIGNVPFVERAFWRIESEEGTIESIGGRYRATLNESSLRFADTKGICDIEIRWRHEENGSLLAFRFIVVNVSAEELHIRNIFPIVTLPARKGRVVFWQKETDTRVLTDEWERCYGDAVVHHGLREQIQSAWDVHLFDVANSLNCTLSYYQVPNAKLSITLSRADYGAALAIRCDTHAGARGVLVRSGKGFSVSEFMVRMHRGSWFDALESYARLVARRNNVQPSSVAPMGWVDWYFAKAQTTEKDVMENLDFIAKELKDFGLQYVQIDSGWQLGVETTPPPHNVIAGGPWTPNSKFPRGMKWFANEIRRRGLTPGIWVRPFHCIDGAKERTEHPDWFNEKGQMDFSHPGVRDYVRDLFMMLTEEWGYEFVKFDFPSFDLFNEWGPKLFSDHSARTTLNNPEQTNIEAYRGSLVAISEAAQGKAGLLACNSIMPPTLGLAGVFRIGDDVGDWSRTFRYGVKSVSARYYTNGVFWTNDPDCLLVREPFTVEQARMWASLISLSGGALFVSEYLSKLPAERLEILKKTLPVFRNGGDGYAFGRPVDLLQHDPPELWHFPIQRSFETWHVVGLFNWSEAEKTKELRLISLGLDGSASYHLFDFWKSEYLGRYQESCSFKLPSMSCLVLSIHKDIGRPQVLSTTRHILQGATEFIDVTWDSRQEILKGIARVIKNNPYEIILFAEKRKVGTLVNANQRDPAKPEVVRLWLSTDETKEVKWTAELKKV